MGARAPKSNRRPKPQPAAGEVRGTAKAPSTRLNRYIASTGYCSRRKADALIAEGRVKVNGVVVSTLGTKIAPGDVVEVNGKRVTPRSFEYVLLNKPSDVITTTQDEKGRRTVLELVADEGLKRAGLFPVGRLDRDTQGVLLLTNDGDLAHRLMHPRFEIQKLYRVRTRGPVKPHELDALRKGVPLEDGPARADQAAYVDPADPHELGIELHEGRNRQIRRMLEALGHEVVRLERVRYAGLTTEGVRRGHWRRLLPHEVERLRRQVKLK